MDISIRQALKAVHDRRSQETGLWRLDSPTEAALVAAMCNRQRGEEVITSVGDPQPQPEEYCFAHLAPPHVRGTAKMRHGYMLGQHAYYCGVELARQKSLPLQKQPQQHQEQQLQQAQRAPCSPCAPAAVHEADYPAAASCRTPASQLRSEQLQPQAQDSSPCNNLVRRLAHTIKTDSSALAATLTEYSSFARRSTASFRSRVSTRSSDCQDSITPLASPGRGWATPPAAGSAPSSLKGSSAQSPTGPHGGAPDAADTAPHQLLDHLASLGLGGTCFGREQSPCSPPHSAAWQHSSMQQQQPTELEGLLPAQVPSLAFKGFGAAGSSQHSLLSSAGSIQLATPRLEPHWPPVNLSNNSSSNGTTDAHMNEHSAACVPSDSAGFTAADSRAGWGNAGSGTADGSGAEMQAAGAEAWPSASEADRVGSPGYWSCDEEEDEAADTAGQDVAAGLTPAAVGSADVATAPGEPCQLPLSPLLLKELAKQLSFHEAGAHQPCPAGDEDAATTCCDWATVYSYEEYE